MAYAKYLGPPGKLEQYEAIVASVDGAERKGRPWTFLFS